MSTIKGNKKISRAMVVWVESRGQYLGHYPETGMVNEWLGSDIHRAMERVMRTAPLATITVTR